MNTIATIIYSKKIESNGTYGLNLFIEGASKELILEIMDKVEAMAKAVKGQAKTKAPKTVKTKAPAVPKATAKDKDRAEALARAMASIEKQFSK